MEKYLLSSLAHFLIGLFIFLELSCRSCLYIFEINSLAAIQKSTSNECWRGCGEENPLTLLVGMQTSTATMENSVEIP